VASNNSLAWKYRPRAVGLVVVVASLGAFEFFGRPDLGQRLARSTTSWGLVLVTLAVVAITLLITGTFNGDARANPERWLKSSWARWLALGLVLVPTFVLGGWARPASGPNIIRLELAGSADVARSITYPPGVLTEAILADIGFIVAYVLLLVLLTRWAGCFYRLQALRQARVAVSFVVVAAGVLDLIEDSLIALGTASSSLGSRDVIWEIAATCAWAKFAILIAAIGYVCAGVWAWLFTPPWVRKASWALPEPAPASEDIAAARPHETPFGIALSGGGIRASSISLGALQVLEREDDAGNSFGWGSASVVTAVSGGSNMAAGWAIARSYYETDEYGAADRIFPPAGEEPWSLHADMTHEEAHLFANLGYLLASSPRATAGNPDAPATVAEKTSDQSTAVRVQRYRPSALATVFAGFIMNVAVLLTVLWVVVTPFGWVLSTLNHDPLEDQDYEGLLAAHNMWFPGLALMALGVVLVLVWVLMGQFLSRDVATSSWKQGMFRSLMYGGYGLLILGAVLLAVLLGLPRLAGWLDSGIQTLAGFLVGAAGVVGSVLRILRKPAASLAPYLGGVALVLFATLTAGFWTARSASMDLVWDINPKTDEQSGWWWVIAIGVLGIVQLCFSPERWSLAAFYRGKLRIAYATYRSLDGEAPGEAIKVYQNDNTTSERHLREPWLHAFRQNGKPSTPLSVCATATVTTRSVKTHYGIPALSVTFDPQRVSLYVPTSDQGTWMVHQAPTEVINAIGSARRKRLTTMLAVAISSAAVSPAMGRIKIGPTRMLLAFANIRLGVWMPNPRYVNAYVGSSAAMNVLSTAERRCEPIGYPPTGLGYLFKEFFGVHDLSDPYVYMTDGGHWENTGLVEMLRRKDVREIICIDADCGTLQATSSLGKAMDLAPLECDVHIQANLDPLRAPISDDGIMAYAPRTATVGFFRQGSDWGNTGVLWYAKPGLARDMPASMLGYRETHSDYPTTKTSDQFFDSSTYIAYRELGRYNGRQILRARKALVAFLAKIEVTNAEGLVENFHKELRSGEQHWVVADLAHAMHFAPNTEQKIALLQSVNSALVDTTRRVRQASLEQPT